MQYLKQSWEWISGHPTLSAFFGISALNVLCLYGTKRLPPDSKLYHACKLVLSVISDGLGALNAVRGMMNKQPIVLEGKTNAADPGIARVKPIIKILAFGVLSMGLFHAHSALAGEWKVGPSCSLTELRLGAIHPLQLAPGLGVQGGYEINPSLSFDVALFGSLLADNGVTAQAKTAAFACYKGFCGGLGVDIASNDGGLVQGNFSKRNWFIVFQANWELLSVLKLRTESAQQPVDNIQIPILKFPTNRQTGIPD